jgi:hypothetical protein
MTSPRNIPTKLFALTSAALAMPGITQAAVPPENPQFGLRYSMYSEDALPAANTLGSSEVDRYDIGVLHLKGIIPYSEKVSFAVDMDYESMSGASPWYLVKDPSSTDAKVIMTGASIDDSRLDMRAAGSYYLPDARLDVNAGFSTEDDYQSFFGGMGTALEFYQQQLVVDMSMSFSADRLEPTPTDRSLPGTDAIRTTDERKGSYGIYVGFTQVVNRLMTFQSGVNMLLKTGYLSDPYKLVQVTAPQLIDDELIDVANTINENRPGDRSSVVWVNRARAYFESYAAALHLDYRYYTDNWELNSHTIDASWHQEFDDNWTLTPGIRLYQQTEASFYAPYYLEPRDDEFYSSDYRLSDFTATSYYFDLRKKLGDVDLIFAYEDYNSKGDSPALTNFMLMTVGFDYRF